MLPVTQAKKSQAIVSDVDYRHLIHSYNYPPDSINLDLAKKSYALQSDVSNQIPSPPLRWKLKKIAKLSECFGNSQRCLRAFACGQEVMRTSPCGPSRAQPQQLERPGLACTPTLLPAGEATHLAESRVPLVKLE